MLEEIKYQTMQNYRIITSWKAIKLRYNETVRYKKTEWLYLEIASRKLMSKKIIADINMFFIEIVKS